MQGHNKRLRKRHKNRIKRKPSAISIPASMCKGWKKSAACGAVEGRTVLHWASA